MTEQTQLIDAAWAYDQNGYFLGEMRNFNPDDNAHVEYTLTPCPPDFWRGRYVNDEWVETGSPPIDEEKSKKRREINAAADAALTMITGQYPRSEIDSWPTQVAEAEAYTADNNAPTPFIDGLVARRPGVTKAELAGRILANATAYKALSADVFGQRQALDDLVDAATTVDEVQAIVVDIQVPA